MIIAHPICHRISWYVSKSIYLLATLWLLTGCTSFASSSEQSPGKLISEEMSSSGTAYPQPGIRRLDVTSELIPSVSVPSARLAASLQIQTRELFLKNVGPFASSLAVDKQYLYFDLAAGLLCRTPLSGGEAEIVMISKYWDVESIPYPSSCKSVFRDNWHSTIFRLRQSKEWLLFTNNASPLLYSPHTIFAYHMSTGKLKEIAYDEDSSSLDDYAVAGDWAVLVTLDFLEDDPECQGNSIVTMINLATDERQELYRGCIRDAFYYDPFAGVALTEEWITLVRRYSDALGGGSEIVLWNRQTNAQQVISGDDYSRFPAMSGDWVAWLVAPENHEIGPDSPEYTVLHQISTGWQQQLYPAYGTDEPHLTDGRWLYWRKLADPEPWQSVYDLSTGRLYTFTTDSPTFSLYSWEIRGNTISWSLDEMKSEDGIPDGYLRWRTGADPTVLMTVNPPPSPTWWQLKSGEPGYRAYGLKNLEIPSPSQAAP